jgi:hypothetical protein
MFGPQSPGERTERARAALHELGCGDLLDRFPPSSPAVSSTTSRSAARSSSTRTCSYSTSRWPPSMP